MVGDEWKEGNEKRLGTVNETAGDEWKEGYEKRLGTVNETVGDEWKEVNEKILGTVNEKVGDEWKEERNFDRERGFDLCCGKINEIETKASHSTAQNGTM